jgi:hypothetical protein
MSAQEEPMLSAQAVLRPASGRSIRGAAITAANLGDYQPAPEAARAALQAFAAAGFQVGPLVGISFSITAPATTFEKFFHTRLPRDERGRIAPGERDAGGYELPLQSLPPGLADTVEAVAFSPPVDFGPTNP